MIFYWLSTRYMTVAVGVSWAPGPACGKVIATPPIVRSFRGQDFGRLLRWIRRHPDFQFAVLG